MADLIKLPAQAKVFSARSLSLDDPEYELQMTTATVYRAELITLSGKHTAPGQDVVLIADRISASDATIDVAGLPGRGYDQGVHATAGSTPVAAGIDADAGGGLPRADDGCKGGNIVIVCNVLLGNLTLRVDGGRGGDGLRGGNGARGAQGAPGQRGASNKADADGRPGGPGGKAGDGGTSGNGGDAGQIVLSVGDRTGCTLIVTSAGGQPGNPGQPGQPGPGGAGGPPGDYGHKELRTTD